MALETLAGSALFGLLVVAVVAFIASRGWRDYTPWFVAAGPTSRGSFAALLRDPRLLALVFVLAVVVVGGAALAFAAGLGGPLVTTAAATVLVAFGTAFGLLAGVAVCYGVYLLLRATSLRRLHRAQAAALVSWVVGLVGVALIAARLLELV